MWSALLPIKRLDKACKCPVCGYKSHIMMRVGHDEPVLRQNKVIGAGLRYVQCLWCGSTDRDRLVYLYLTNHCPLFQQENLKILHIAPEKCLSKVLRKKAGQNYIPADINTRKYWYIKGMVKMDITDIGYADNTFDLILCNHVLEHIPDDRKAMRELCRVLKPNGIMMLQVPIAAGIDTIEYADVHTAEERLRLYGQKDHVRLYGRDYAERLKNTGGRVHITNIAEQYPQHGVNSEEQLYVLEK